MQIFLLWRKNGFPPRTGGEIEGRLKATFAPFLKARPIDRLFASRSVEGLAIEIPVVGWRPASFEAEGAAWAYCLDYPVDAKPRLKAAGESGVGGALLPLARRLQADPLPLLRELSPPFTLIWGGTEADDAVYLQNDGLGFSQLFEYDDGRRWAISNRILAFEALGLRIEPDPEHWAVRCALGWFPLQLSGYRNISFAPPGLRLRIAEDGIARDRLDVIEEWVNPPRVAKKDAVEAGFAAVREHLIAARELWTHAEAGLTGGRDSRAIVAALDRLESNAATLRVRGLRTSPDAALARRLADLAGAPLKVLSDAALPPPDSEGLRDSIVRGLLWQAGYGDLRQAKLFSAINRRLPPGGIVNIMGQHGEIGRAHYAIRIGAFRTPAELHEAALLNRLLKRARPWLRPSMRDLAESAFIEAFRQADGYGLSGLDRLDFFYLFERTRRWASGGQHSQRGQVIVPFLAPGFIRAVYSLAPQDRASAPIHRALLDHSQSAWIDVPYASDLTGSQLRQMQKGWSRELPAATRRLRKLFGSFENFASAFRFRPDYLSARNNFNADRYWRGPGAQLLSESLASKGLWTRVYDPDRVRKSWSDVADDLLVMHLAQSLPGFGR